MTLTLTVAGTWEMNTLVPDKPTLNLYRVSPNSITPTFTETSCGEGKRRDLCRELRRKLVPDFVAKSA